MGVLVGLTIAWITAMAIVTAVYTFGGPARRLFRIRRDVDIDAEEIRQAATANRKSAVEALKTLTQPIDATLSTYQDSRRGILPGAQDYRWSDKDLANWKQREIAERGRVLRTQNFHALVLWNVLLTAGIGLTGWIYYQNFYSQIRPQGKSATFTTPTHP